VIDDAGHTPHLESPAAFSRIATDFVSTSPTTA
jgi:pimeloyl-ACP methyl ester carboxylesterase